MAENVEIKNLGRPKLQQFANGLWEKMVVELGAAEAKEIMRTVMGSKAPGPRFTDEHFAIFTFVYAYIFHWGRNPAKKLGLTDKKIALFISETNPRFVQLESGHIFIANDFITEDDLTKDDLSEEGLPRDPIVNRWPVNKSLEAWEQQVARIRRKAIKDGALPKEEYAPRPYRRG